MISELKLKNFLVDKQFKYEAIESHCPLSKFISEIKGKLDFIDEIFEAIESGDVDE